MSAQWTLSGEERTRRGRSISVAFDPTWATTKDVAYPATLQQMIRGDGDAREFIGLVCRAASWPLAALERMEDLRPARYAAGRSDTVTSLRVYGLNPTRTEGRARA